MNPTQVPKAAKHVCQKLTSAGHRAVVVGGCVRDTLMDRAPHDWDVATSAAPDVVQGLFPKVIPTGIEHGTVTVVVGDEHIEVTTFRTDGTYTDGRRPDAVKLGVTLEEDLSRRDFTINAMAFDPVNDVFVDPFGGREDLRASKICTVGEPGDRFMEDGLRMMRAVRFAATLGFDIDVHTCEGIRTSLSNIQGVSQERIRDELVKLLGASAPSVGLAIAAQVGLLEKVLPELKPSFGHPQNQWHAHDVWGHTLVTIDNTKGDAICRMGALLHDVGKPASAQPAYGEGQFSFHGHDETGGEIAQDVVERLKFSNEDKDRIVGMVRHHMALFGWKGPDTPKKSVRKIIRKLGDRIPDIITLSFADIIGKGTGQSPEERLPGVRELIWEVMGEIASGKSAVKTNQLAINGRDVMLELGIKPGAQVGIVLRALLDRVMDNPDLNTRESLLKLVPQIEQVEC